VINVTQRAFLSCEQQHELQGTEDSKIKNNTSETLHDSNNVSQKHKQNHLENMSLYNSN